MIRNADAAAAAVVVILLACSNRYLIRLLAAAAPTTFIQFQLKQDETECGGATSLVCARSFFFAWGKIIISIFAGFIFIVNRRVVNVFDYSLYMCPLRSAHHALLHAHIM